MCPILTWTIICVLFSQGQSYPYAICVLFSQGKSYIHMSRILAHQGQSYVSYSHKDNRMCPVLTGTIMCVLFSQGHSNVTYIY